MSRPLVSIITPTWQRHDLLLDAIENVRAQTYPNIEHVIVSDGEDDTLWYKVKAAKNADSWEAAHIPIRWAECGRNWSSFLPNSYAAAPLLVAQFMARGAYQMFLADDERMAPDHITSLVDALEAAGADFAYSRAEMWWRDNPDERWTIGSDPPAHGQITNCLYRADLLQRGTYPIGAGDASDWACIERWMQAGAIWAYVPRVTLSHRADR